MRKCVVFLLFFIVATTILFADDAIADTLFYNETAQDIDPLQTFYLPKSPAKAALLSALIPGGGQIYNERYIKAGFYIATQATLVGVALHYDKQFKKYQGRIKDKDDPQYAYNYVQYKDAYEYRQSYIFWVAAGVFITTLDAFVDAHLMNFADKKRDVHIKFEGDKVVLSVQIP